MRTPRAVDGTGRIVAFRQSNTHHFIAADFEEKPAPSIRNGDGLAFPLHHGSRPGHGSTAAAQPIQPEIASPGQSLRLNKLRAILTGPSFLPDDVNRLCFTPAPPRPFANHLDSWDQEQQFKIRLQGESFHNPHLFFMSSLQT
jgi:hypothetical protein